MATTIHGNSKAKIKRMLLSLLKHIDDKDMWEAKFEQDIVCTIIDHMAENRATGFHSFTLKWQKMPKKSRRKRAIAV